MGPVALIGASLAIAAIGTGYGIYASQRAQSQAAQQYKDAQAQAQQQQAQQAQMLKSQQAQQQAQLASQTQAQQDAYAKQQAMEQGALTTAQGQIAPNQQALGQNLLAQENQAYAQQAPLIEARLNSLGLLQSGALPEAQAKYQAQLESQRQAALATYGTSAEQALQQQALNYTGTDVNTLNQNLNNTLTAQQQALQQQFAGQDTAYTNDVAQQQYLSQLGAANNASQQAAANQYINFGATVGGGALNYFGKQGGSTSSPSGPGTGYFTGTSGSGTPTNGIIGSSNNTFDPLASSYGNPSVGALQYYRQNGYR